MHLSSKGGGVLDSEERNTQEMLGPLLGRVCSPHVGLGFNMSPRDQPKPDALGRLIWFEK